MFIHRQPRHRLARLLPACLRVMALFGLLFAAAALLGHPAGESVVPTRPAALGDEVSQVAGQQPAPPHPAH